MIKKESRPDSIAPFENPPHGRDDGKYVLCLYIAGNTPKSARAVGNLKQLCETRLKDRYELTIIDLYDTPQRAQAEQVLCAPTLVKQLPKPVRRLIGDLSDARRVLLALDLETSVD